MPLTDLGPAPVSDPRLTDLGPANLTDLGPAPATHEDAMHLAGTEILRQNILRDRLKKDHLNTSETQAIMDAYKIMAGQQPDKLRTQIEAETKHNTMIARGVLGDVDAAAFESLTSYVPSIAGLIDPETGLQLKQGQQITANVNEKSIAGQAASMGVGLAKFALAGPVAIAEAALSGAGEQRMSVAEARARGKQVGDAEEALQTTARGVVDGVLAKLFMKTGGRASNVVRSLIQPQVKAALARDGLDSAKKLAWAWAVDTLKVGALSETQYLADVGLEHLNNPEVRPTEAEALKAAAFGIALPSVMGAIHGGISRARAELSLPGETRLPGGTPAEAGPVVPGTENLPIERRIVLSRGGPLATVEKPRVLTTPPPPPVTALAIIPPGGGPLATIPKPPPIITPPPTGGNEPVYTPPGPDAPRVLAPFPPEGSIRLPAIMDLISHAPGGPVAPPAEAHPAGREPTIVTGVTVPKTAGTGADPERVYISKALPATLDINGTPVDVQKFVALHETLERKLRDAGMSDDLAHAQATFEEHVALRQAGIDPVAYEAALAPHVAKAAQDVAKAPADLDPRPYQKPTPAVPRPASVMTQERDIEQHPNGHQVATPHLTYDVADKMSPKANSLFGTPVPGQAAGENIWVRPAGGKSNAKRVLLVQFSTHLINEGRPRTGADDYYDKLYANRPGYSRPTDFWELPQWIGVAAKNLPNADVYVVRNLAEAREFLKQAKYGQVAMSALDVNTKLAQGLIEGYEGKVAIGGYTDMTPFGGRPNVKVYKAMPDFVKDQGRPFSEGTDYRHFKGTEVVPRLTLSEGCLHNCDFCGVEGKGHAPTEKDPKTVAEQIASFGDLNYRLVYINDKTFWQAKNAADLPALYEKLKAANPKFDGFVVQTSAAMMQKVTPEMIRNSHVAYVEMGVESYNDSILASVRKPAREKSIDAAVQAIREGGAKFIPNIMIGLPGETPETYARTLSFLERNHDIISHVNAYNVALYEGSKLSEKVGGKKAETDADENVTRKSWQATPEVDQAFHDKVMDFGSKALDTPTPLPAGEPGIMDRLKNAVTGEGGAVPVENIAFLAQALGGEDIGAAARQARDTITSAAGDLQRTFSPGSRGEQAKQTVAEMRQENSRAARKADIRYRAFDASRRAFDVYTRVHGQAAADDFMDRINRGERQADPELQSLADTMDAERKAKVKTIQGLGVGAGEKFDENWFGRQWQQADQARNFFRARRPLTGSKTFLKGRTLESVAEGRTAGFKLVTDNPVEMHILKMGEMDKYIAGVQVIKALEANGAAMRVQSGDPVPEGWQRIHDQIGLYKAKNPVTGELEKGSFYAPEQVATLINNHLSPGLRGKAWFQTYLGAANWLNQFQLGMSGFHLAFTSADAIISQVALGLRRAVNYGDIGAAVKDLLGAPLAPVTNAMRGHKGLAEWFRPGSQGAQTHEIIGILEDAGARVQSDPFYRTHVTDKMLGAFRRGNVLGGLGRALLLPVELPTRFIMDLVVPRQKLGVAMALVEMEMKNNPGASRDALVAKARSIWDSADNRMGQLVYDNLFWNRLTKDVAMATVRSVGWNLGTFREVLGGTADLLRAPTDILRGKSVELTNRAAYLIALPTVHAMIGSFLNYVFTGEGPQNLKDAFFPRTGGVDEKGNPNRISLPTYAKDIYHFGKEPLKTLVNKIHPILQLIYEMETNKDFYGVAIRNEDDPVMQQVKQEARHVLESLEPLSSRNMRRDLEQGQSPFSASKSFIGLTPAPSVMNLSVAEQVASEMIRQKIPTGARTQAAADKADLKRQLRRAIREGNTQQFAQALGEGKISPRDADDILAEARLHPLEAQFKHLSAPEAVKVWQAATPEERAILKKHMIDKLDNYMDSATPSEVSDLIAQYRAAGVF